MSKVQYGLKNVHFAVWNAESSQYDTPVALKGAVSMTTDPQGESSVFYADDVAYETFHSNGGYSGTITVAALNKDFLTKVVGLKEDVTSKVLYETSDAKQVSVALTFEVNGNENKQRAVFYNVTFARPKDEHNTQAESISPDTFSLEFNAIGRDFQVNGENENVIRAYLDGTPENKTEWDAWNKKIAVPGVAASPGK